MSSRAEPDRSPSPGGAAAGPAGEARSPAGLETRLGHHFGDRGLLEQALTHRSRGAHHNERLEFLGDGVLGCIMAEVLYARFPELPEGQLTRLRADLVREEALCEVAARLDLAASIDVADAERIGADGVRPSILADAMEAVFGAIFLDGGYAKARAAVIAAYGETLATLDPDAALKDAKTRLQEWLQGRRQALPEYRVKAVRGAAHRQTFEVECVVESPALRTTGHGTSRQRAEQDAAAAALARLPG